MLLGRIEAVRGLIENQYRRVMDDGKGQANTALEALGQIPIEIDGETLSLAWSDTLSLADELRLTVYDACYLELALRRRLPLATLDQTLRAAARKIDVPVIA